MSAGLPVSLPVYGSVFVFTRLPDAAGLSFIIQEKQGPVKKNIPGDAGRFSGNPARFVRRTAGILMAEHASKSFGEANGWYICRIPDGAEAFIKP